MVFEIALAIPGTSTFFMELKGQWRYVSSATIGPFTTTANNPATLPAMKVNYSMFLLSLGIGLGR